VVCSYEKKNENFLNGWKTIIFPTALLPGVSSGSFCMTPAHSRQTRASTVPSKQVGVQKTLTRVYSLIPNNALIFTITLV